MPLHNPQQLLNARKFITVTQLSSLVSIQGRLDWSADNEGERPSLRGDASWGLGLSERGGWRFGIYRKTIGQ